MKSKQFKSIKDMQKGQRFSQLQIPANQLKEVKGGTIIEDDIIDI